MIYQAEEATEPFWAEYSGKASGRDPLAVQNSSVVIYARMMVGITNVTNRVRYLGFYCWLLELILKNAEIKGSITEQFRYIRRAELLLAYMMVSEFPEVTGVSGSAFAHRTLQQVMSLRDGADLDSPHTSGLYWTFKAGVFGQYYSGVLRELGLILHPGPELNIYSVREAGTLLANFFEANIPGGSRDAFWDCVYRGEVRSDQLSQFSSFALHLIPESEEETFYRELLLAADSQDNNSDYRKQTILLLLSCLDELDEEVRDLPLLFLRENYRKLSVQTELQDSAAAAWYLYELNELTHVALEHFHACLLWSLDVYPLPLEGQLEALVAATGRAFSEMDQDSREILLKDLAPADTYQNCYEMQAALREADYGLCLAKAILTLVSVHRDCRSQLSRLRELAALPHFNFDRAGYVVELLPELIEQRGQLSLEKYTRSLLLLVINLHVFSSYSKTRIGQALVHNYMIEENMIWRLRETFPNRTTPRLQNAIQYMDDLKWLSRSERKLFITELGKNLLADEN